MASRCGVADLPLHRGTVPLWLSARMARLGRLIVEVLTIEYGRAEVLRRLAHPFWFQSFGAVMGMDWHSSGVTTSVLGALKRGLAPIEWELGLHVCGGRGRHSRRTPDELLRVGDRTGLDGAALARTSRLVAKVDSAAVQDGFSLYLHAFVVTDDGCWTVVQQGMNADGRQARRYHWLSESLESFVDDPHAAIEGPSRGTIVNLADRRARDSRRAQIQILGRGPDYVIDHLRRAPTPEISGSLPHRGPHPAQADPRPRSLPLQLPLPHLSLPAHHEVTANDVVLRRLHGTLAAATARGPKDFPDLLLVHGVGPRTIRALAQVAELLHGTPCRFTDPARFAFAHGGKDGHPFPVPLAVYDATITVLRRAVEHARLGQDDKISALRRLDAEARRLEQIVTGPSFDDVVREECAASRQYGGRTVFGARP